MARRTIRARRSSPYLIALVVIFAVLFVAAAVGFGWVWSLRNDDLMKTFGQSRIEVASKGDQDPFEPYKKYGKSNLIDIIEAQEALAEDYRSLVPPLTKQINGDVPANLDISQLKQSVANDINASAEAIKAVASTLQKSFEGTPGGEKQAELKATDLVNAMRDQSIRIDALVNQVKRSIADQTVLATNIDKLQGELKSNKDESQRLVAQLQADLRSERNRLEMARESAQLLTKQVEQKLNENVNQWGAEKRDWLKQMDIMKKDYATIRGQLTEVSNQITVFKRVPTLETVDGRIIRLSDQTNVAYGDLGKKDGIVNGMTFSILAPGELGKDEPVIKAQCHVVKMEDNSCELRIELLKKDTPVVMGDLLVNPTYNRSQRLSFFLIGRMDLGNGVDATEQLKGLIQRNNSRVDSALSVQTDYLILGEPPVLPAAPKDTTPMVQGQYEQAKLQFIAYQEAKSNARDMGIVVYPVNKLMAMMGLAGKEP
jgi:hypothetical protein